MTTQAFSLQNKVALVTGGSRGIGASICKRLARAGAQVFVNYNSNEAAAQEVLAEVKKDSPESEIIGFDVSVEADVDRAISEILGKREKIDILVANAGISIDALLPRSKAEHFEKVINTNLMGTINCVKAVSRSMMRNRYGRIVCISSVVGKMGNKGQSAYAASKAGIFGFAKSVARELASRNVTCNVLAPGYIETEMSGSLDEKVLEAWLQTIPAGRVGTPEEVAAAVQFLASEEAGYITGASLDINGGILMD